MSRIKQRSKILHTPSTHEIFYCLSQSPGYCKTLLDEQPQSSFSNFLKWLIEINFYNDVESKITTKRLATEFKSDAAKVTKWIHDIYEEIFDLNYDKPHLFQNNGIGVSLHLKSYDNFCTFKTSISVIPREFEDIEFPFVKAKMGTARFWVKKVQHEIADTTSVAIWLQGDFLNKYTEFAIDKALFYGWIGYSDTYRLYPFELDDQLKQLFRS
jgi:hypothetical protein